MTDDNNFDDEAQIEEIIGQTVLELLATQQTITLPRLLQAVRQLPEVEQVQRAEQVLRRAFTVCAA